MGLNVARLLTCGGQKRRYIVDAPMMHRRFDGFFFTRQNLMARRFVLELSISAVMSFLFFAFTNNLTYVPPTTVNGHSSL
jgi:hypothetical protein